jgi:hypothetical protein
MRKTPGFLSVLVFIASILFLISVYASCARSQQPQDGPQSFVMKTCTACHDTQRICNALGKKDKDAWTQTVTRMKDHGAAVDQNTIPVVVDFLSGLAPGSQPICK